MDQQIKKVGLSTFEINIKRTLLLTQIQGTHYRVMAKHPLKYRKKKEIAMKYDLATFCFYMLVATACFMLLSIGVQIFTVG